MPKISIIIPLYNKAPYIRKALDSVATQTYQDLECIIMDDGSADGSKQIAERWVKENSCRWGCRCRLFSQTNAGVAAARNNAVAQSTADFLCFLDADDWWEPSFLEEMVRFAEKVPDAGLWASNYVYYKPGKTRVGVTNLSYIDGEKGIINYPKSYFEGTGMPVWTGAVMMRRSLFDELGGFPLGVRLGEDFLLWAKIALRYPVAFLDKPLAYYNNDVPPSLRLTRNLHDPQTHMLFMLEPIEEKLDGLSSELRYDWRLLLAKLRAEGMLDYWLETRYHDLAVAELQKIDWSLLSFSAKAPYMQPVWIVRLRKKIMMAGSYCKQRLITLLHLK